MVQMSDVRANSHVVAWRPLTEALWESATAVACGAEQGPAQGDTRAEPAPCRPVTPQKVCSTTRRNSVGSTASTGTGPSLARNSYPVSGPYLSPPADTWPSIWNRISIEGC